MHHPGITNEIVNKLAGQTSFSALPRHWVECTFSWITRSRRNIRDYERITEHSEAFIHWSMFTMTTRRLANAPIEAAAREWFAEAWASATRRL